MTTFNESEITEYCRNKGLFLNQPSNGKRPLSVPLLIDLKVQKSSAKRCLTNIKTDKQAIKKLERELHRKDKALAETAALLVFTKNAHEIADTAGLNS